MQHSVSRKEQEHDLISSPASTLTAITTWEEMKVWIGKLGLNMTNETHTDESKMVQLYYFGAWLCYI